MASTVLNVTQSTPFHLDTPPCPPVLRPTPHLPIPQTLPGNALPPFPTDLPPLLTRDDDSSTDTSTVCPETEYDFTDPVPDITQWATQINNLSTIQDNELDKFHAPHGSLLDPTARPPSPTNIRDFPQLN